ncbi:NmrA family NAD(P)-binding protein [Ancylomarina longa]|uniref:NAD-dependent epimerase/dehydratase family protein n=1 Tax=Ancylomarina longa TaxID=2487017 RepID=A0A434AWT2_9BACT|nr:NmrA family NAD(P)-binding protein [Ancylomarina longa]RUT78980.1 NAD-dependent epimerase/dehydratase family protein [Ancylomarina longa]
MENKILITGATGNIGSEIVKQLKAKNANFVAGTSNGKAINGIETVKFNFADNESLKNAFQGITTLFLLLPSHPEAANWGENVIKLAKESGINHIVRSSGMFANANSDLLIEKLLGSTDEFLKESGINYTITAPSSFMQNFSTQMVNDYKAGVIYQAADDAKINWVDTRDIAAVNIEALLNPDKYLNQTLKITGNESFNYADAINKMNSILGKETQYVAIPNEAAAKAMADMHFPQFVIDLLISLNNSIKEGHLVETTNIVEDVLGRKAITFNQFVEYNKNVWL